MDEEETGKVLPPEEEELIEALRPDEDDRDDRGFDCD